MATHLYFPFLLSVRISPFLRFQFQSLSFPAPQAHPCPRHVGQKGEREKQKKKDKSLRLLAGNNQEISKCSWFAIGLNERTAFLKFFSSFSLTSSLPFCPLVFQSFSLFVLVSLCFCYNHSFKLLSQISFLLACLLLCFLSSQVPGSSDLCGFRATGTSPLPSHLLVRPPIRLSV